MAKTLLAHVREDQETGWHIHSLTEHLEGVSELASMFASRFGLEKLSSIQGLVHDAGKASDDFQQKIAGKSGYNPDAHTNKAVDHSTAGGQFIIERYGAIAIPLAYSIMGHHGGLPNGFDENDSCLKQRCVRSVADYKTHLPELKLPDSILPSDYILKKSRKPLKAHFLIRMLFSALTDADFIDTERFMSPEKGAMRHVGNIVWEKKDCVDLKLYRQ